MSRIRPHLTFANVTACVALFVALGGTAYALETNSVKSKHIKNGQVKSSDVGEELAIGASPGTQIAKPFNTGLSASQGFSVGRESSNGGSYLILNVGGLPNGETLGLFNGTPLELDGGHVQFSEQVTPAAPPPNKARIFARDSGAAGHTELMVIFPNGDVDHLATDDTP